LPFRGGPREVPEVGAREARRHDRKLDVPYVRASSSAEKDGEWCGDFRQVEKLLKTVPKGTWLLFVDADAAFRCGAHVSSEA